MIFVLGGGGTEWEHLSPHSPSAPQLPFRAGAQLSTHNPELPPKPGAHPGPRSIMGAQSHPPTPSLTMGGLPPKSEQGGSRARAPSPPPPPSRAMLIRGRPAEGSQPHCCPMGGFAFVFCPSHCPTSPHRSGWERRTSGEGGAEGGGHSDPLPPPTPPLWVQDPIPSHRRGRLPRLARQGRVTSQHSNVSLRQ